MQQLKLASARVLLDALPVQFILKFYEPNYAWSVECVTALLEAAGCENIDYDAVMCIVIERFIPEGWLYKIVSVPTNSQDEDEDTEEDAELLVTYFTDRKEAEDERRHMEIEHGRCFRVRPRPIDENLKRDFTFMMKNMYDET